MSEISTKSPAPLLDLNSPATRRACAWIILGLMLLGAIGRLKQYIARPSYWNDEAAVVANVIQRDWRHLLDRLDFAQAAPPAFLWIERGLYKWLGPSEYSLRLFPLMCSLLALPLYAKLAWRTLPPTSACWAFGWFALFQKILHHGIDVKQYPSDICVAVVLLLIVFGDRKKGVYPLFAPIVFGDRKKGVYPLFAPRRMVFLSVAATFLLWLSFPVVFLFGALSLTLLPGCFRFGKKGIAIWLAGGALVLLSFIGLSRAALSHGGDPSLVEFWHASFPDFHQPAKIPFWLGREVYGLFAYPFDSFGLFTTLLAILGCIALANLHQKRLLAVLPLALLLAFGAAALHHYPFPGRHRLGLYLVPVALLILGAGAEGQNLKAGPALCKWWWLLPGPLILLEMGQLAKDLAYREEDSTTRPVVEYVRAARRADEPIYLFGDSLSDAPASGRSAEFLCYWPDAPGKVVVGYSDPKEIREKRFWVVYSLNRPDKTSPLFTEQLRGIFGPRVHVTQSCQPGRQSGAMLFCETADGSAKNP